MEGDYQKAGRGVELAIKFKGKSLNAQLVGGGKETESTFYSNANYLDCKRVLEEYQRMFRERTALNPKTF